MTRNDDGFTLIETLTALLVVSLSLACIVAATTEVTHINRRIADSHKQAVAANETVARVSAMLRAQEPVMAEDLSGNADGFECLTGNCRFRAKPLRVTYVSGGKTSEYWPPLHWQQSAADPRLEGVILNDKAGRTLAVIDLAADEPKDCIFDMISRTCRALAAKAAS
jgi:prepilin-type N-terminal cleavage/methylation domain-containing protein